jgi:Reverse transcriptase (RNA-dependent DNA polymerase)
LEIKVREGAKLPRAKQRRFTREEAQEIKRQVEELLRLGKIRVSRSESAVGTLFVPKSDGTKRWCMDLRPVNAVTVSDENKAPFQDITRERIRGAKYFTRLDMRDGYHHLRIKEGSEKYTAFITEYGLFEWVVACFGLKNAPAEFARYMSDILREYLNDFVVVYFDDIIIFSNELDAHWEHVREVLGKLRERDVNLKIKKCELAVRETEYLGHIINGETTRMRRIKSEPS